MQYCLAFFDCLQSNSGFSLIGVLRISYYTVIKRSSVFSCHQVVKDNWERKCKCHGSSDSCTTKTCWRVVPTIEKIGEELWKLYKNAVRTRWDSKAKKLYDRAKSKKNKKVEVTRSQLAFFANSEDFCRQNLPMGIMGTVGRVCNSSSTGHDGCATMCCGRNYKTKIVLKKEKCNCRFVWCCNIKCDTCPRNVSVDTCL